MSKSFNSSCLSDLPKGALHRLARCPLPSGVTAVVSHTGFGYSSDLLQSGVSRALSGPSGERRPPEKGMM